MKTLLKGFVGGLIFTGMVLTVAEASNPIEGGSSETVTNNWDAGFQLTIGRNTADNMLTITNGGTVFSGVGIVGELPAADGNSVVVSGSGSSWSNVADLAIGNSSSDNSLIIEDGGLVYNANGVIGVEENADNNMVSVSGTHSLWNNSDTLMVGRKGDGNSLQILDGAAVNSSFGAIGFENTAVGNTVLVDGVGSVWNNSGDLLIGSIYNGLNSLTIQNSGKVIIGGQLDIYYDNDLYLDDGGWLRIDGHADLDFSDTFHYNAGATLEVTGSVWFDGNVADRNTLIFQGKDATWLGSGLSSLRVGGTGNENTVVISNQASITVYNAEIENTGNQILISGEDSQFLVSSNLFIIGSDNELRIRDGGTASVHTGYVGNAAASANNQIVVEGDGSTLLSEGAVYLGYGDSSGNRIEVRDGGSAVLSDIYVGYTNASHNTLEVNGSNSTFSAAGLKIGQTSSSNSFAVLNGALASSSTSVLGSGTNGNGNVAIVTGAGSYWDAGALTIGDVESTNHNNILTIADGGQVRASELVLTTNGTGNALNLNEGGWLTVASDMNAAAQGFNWAEKSTLEVQGSITNLYGVHDGMNTLILSSGGIWSNDVVVTVGQNNSSNLLKLVDGGVIEGIDATVGQSAASDFNTVEISGAGSIWSNYSDFVLGEFGSDNTLTLTNGGSLASLDDTVLGREVGADRNTLVVHGSGSDLATPFGAIIVGESGSGSTLSALEGGTIRSGSGFIGALSDQNRVLIQDAGSEWTMSSSLRVGVWGADNELTVSNGAMVSVAGSTYIGDWSGSDGNSVRVEGADSRWYNTINIHVGHAGSGNELSILNGAQLYNDIGLLGTDNGSDHNLAVIDGDGSLWRNHHTFFVGNSGSSNTVIVQNAAQLVDTTGYIGYHTNAIGNRVVVDDAVWKNSDGLFVGFNGSGNQLLITNAAEVFSGESRIGAEGTANDNQVLVTGEGSVWYINESLLVGNEMGSNNVLSVESGGRVVVDENISVGSGSWLNINDGGMLTIYGDTLFTDGFNIASGGTIETFGGISGLGGVLESGRTLRLAGVGSSWTEPGDILLETGAVLDVGAGATVTTPSNYTQQAAATLRFGVSTNDTGAPLIGSLNVGQVADFASGANLFYTNDVMGLDWDETYTNTLVTAHTLVIGGQTNATTADLVNYLNIGGPLLLNVSLFTENQNIMAIVNRLRLSGALNPSNDDLRSVLDEIEDRAIAGDPLATREIDLIKSLSPAQGLAQVSQFYTRGIPTYQHMDGVLLGLKQIDKRTSEMLTDTQYYVKPVGAYGPAVSDGEWRGWVSAYGSYGSRSASDDLSGYDAGTYGTALGVDKSLDNMILGLSGGIASSTIDQDDGDTSDASTAYGALYTSFRFKEIDWDLIGSYGSSSVENESGTIFGSDAEIDAATMVFYIGASEEADYGSFTLAPVVAFQAANYSQDGYNEVSTNAVGRTVDSYDRWSYKSIVGIRGASVKALKNFDLITRMRASWQHEFNTDTDSLQYTLIDGNDPHYFTIQSPVADAFDLGVSIGALFSENLEVSLGLDGRYSSDFTAISYNGRIQYSF